MIRSLSVSLLYSAGPLFQPQRLCLAVHASGGPFPQGPQGRLSATGRDLAIADADLSADEVDALCRAAGEAGFGDRVPRVSAVVDTSDSAAFLLLRVEHERGAFTLSLHLMSSGFEGPDAPALKRFLSLLLGKAGPDFPDLTS